MTDLIRELLMKTLPVYLLPILNDGAAVMLNEPPIRIMENSMYYEIDPIPPYSSYYLSEKSNKNDDDNKIKM
jgi:hypothetical protein